MCVCVYDVPYRVSGFPEETFSRLLTGGGNLQSRESYEPQPRWVYIHIKIFQTAYSVPMCRLGAQSLKQMKQKW